MKKRFVIIAIFGLLSLTMAGDEYTDTLTNVVYTYNPNDNSAEVKAEVRTIYHDSEGGFSEVVKPGSPDVAGDIAILDKFMIEGHEYTVSQIGRGAFIYYCNDLTAVTLPETIVSIGDVAFYCCYNLVRVEIPKTVTSIGRSAFGQCINLVSVFSHIEDPFDTDAFELLDASEITLFVPKGCSMKYKAVNGWRNFNNIVEMESTGIPLPQKIEQTKTKDTIFNLLFVIGGKDIFVFATYYYGYTTLYIKRAMIKIVSVSIL